MSLIAKQTSPAFEAAHVVEEKLGELQHQLTEATYQDAVVRGHFVRNASIGLITVGIGLLLLLSLVSIRGISRTVSKLGDLVGRLAAGDLTARCAENSKDELVEIIAAFNKLGDSLQEVITGLAGAGICRGGR